LPETVEQELVFPLLRCATVFRVFTWNHPRPPSWPACPLGPQPRLACLGPGPGWWPGGGCPKRSKPGTRVSAPAMRNRVPCVSPATTHWPHSDPACPSESKPGSPAWALSLGGGLVGGCPNRSKPGTRVSAPAVRNRVPCVHLQPPLTTFDSACPSGSQPGLSCLGPGPGWWSGSGCRTGRNRELVFSAPESQNRVPRVHPDAALTTLLAQPTLWVPSLGSPAWPGPGGGGQEGCLKRLNRELVFLLRSRRTVFLVFTWPTLATLLAQPTLWVPTWALLAWSGSGYWADLRVLCRIASSDPCSLLRNFHQPPPGESCWDACAGPAPLVVVCFGVDGSSLSSPLLLAFSESQIRAVV